MQDENRQLVDRLIKYKAKDAEKMNEENESFLKYVQIAECLWSCLIQVLVYAFRRSNQMIGDWCRSDRTFCMFYASTVTFLSIQ